MTSSDGRPSKRSELASQQPPTNAPQALVGDDVTVACLDGTSRRYVNLDAAASTGALPSVADGVAAFIPWYSSVHRGTGMKSRLATERFEQARDAVARFAGRDENDVAIICRNTTEAINHLAFRLELSPSDRVVTTVVEHHANLLPWARYGRPTHVECDAAGTFTVDDVTAALDTGARPRLLAITGASNVTGWMPDLEAIIDAAHERGVPVMVDAAQLAPHRPLPPSADFVVFSGHKMYAPFGGGALVGPRSAFADGDPFLAGGGAVDLVDLDEVFWTAPPDREEAGSPNVVGAVALGLAIEALERTGWDSIIEHDDLLADRLRSGLRAIPGVRVLGPDTGTLPLAAFVVEGVHHALVAARLSAEHGIGVRHGCFCAHPYLLRLLQLDDAAVQRFRAEVLRGDRRSIPGAVRASAGINTTPDDVDQLLAAVADIAGGSPTPVPYEQDDHGDFWPVTDVAGWTDADRPPGAACGR